jgi:integrase
MRLKLYRGVWSAVWTEGGETKRRSLRTDDRAAAERLLADYKAAESRPGNTVASIYDAYLADKGTDRAKWAWARLEAHFGSFRPDQINRKVCRDYATARHRAKVGDGTVHTELTYLRAALRWHDKNTPAVVELPSKPPPRDRHLSRAQYEHLLAAAETPHIRLFIVLALTTAGRMAAVLDLTWDRVDFERGIIRLGTGEKRRKGRATVPMTDRSKSELLEVAKARTCDHVIEFGGSKVARIAKAFKRNAVAAGLPWCTPHVLRHTAAVWMAEAGVPMSQIAQVLGHTDSRITERVYARYSPDYLRMAVSALG